MLTQLVVHTTHAELVTHLEVWVENVWKLIPFQMQL